MAKDDELCCCICGAHIFKVGSDWTDDFVAGKYYFTWDYWNFQSNG